MLKEVYEKTDNFFMDEFNKIFKIIFIVIWVLALFGGTVSLVWEILMLAWIHNVCVYFFFVYLFLVSVTFTLGLALFKII